jgi:protoheme IX farnesyltransferase
MKASNSHSRSLTSTLSAYYYLTKPGIIYGNLVTAAAGFLLASRNHFYPVLLIETLLGLALVIASACTFNNYLDRGIDQKMKRTKSRALVIGTISSRAALIYGTLLGICGYFILAAFTNWLVVGAAALAQFVYVILYGLAKRRTIYSTLIGAVPGAIPPVVGYLALTNRVDSAAVILFLILVFWQLPHFYSIGLYRYKDYKAAGLPILPVIKGETAAKRQIIGYILAFTASATLLSIYGYSGYIYLAAALVLGFGWLSVGIKNYHISGKLWGRQMFLLSLVVNLGISILIAFGWALP